MQIRDDLGRVFRVSQKRWYRRSLVYCAALVAALVLLVSTCASAMLFLLFFDKREGLGASENTLLFFVTLLVCGACVYLIVSAHRSLYGRSGSTTAVCRACDYDLRGLEVDSSGLCTCPECGAVWRRSRIDLRKSLVEKP